MSQVPTSIVKKLKQIRLSEEDKLKMRKEIKRFIEKNPVIKKDPVRHKLRTAN